MKNSSKGQSLVETSLILASFMGLLLGMAGVGQALFVRQALADRARDAARWGALHDYDPAAIRSVVVYGTPTPAADAAPIVSIAPEGVTVRNPDCPGPDCRVVVSIPDQGIQSTEPM